MISQLERKKGLFMKIFFLGGGKCVSIKNATFVFSLNNIHKYVNITWCDSHILYFSSLLTFLPPIVVISPLVTPIGGGKTKSSEVFVATPLLIEGKQHNALGMMRWHRCGLKAARSGPLRVYKHKMSITIAQRHQCFALFNSTGNMLQVYSHGERQR